MNDTSILETQKFHLGSKIICSDGEEGTLVQVGFDSAARRITHIGIRQGRFFGKTTYLPYDTVTNATGEGVTLRIPGADVLDASKNAPNAVFLVDKAEVLCSLLPYNLKVALSPISLHIICALDKTHYSQRNISQI